MLEDAEDVTGSGFAIEFQGRLVVVTNAHVCAHASFVSVRRLGEAKKYRSRVLEISHDIDLCILTVDSTEFFHGMAPLRLSPNEPHLQDEVSVAGYPEGGDSISVTRGIVSRIEAGPYTETLDMLTIQIDAAINPGNSGGPVFSRDNKMIGVAFAGLDHADNIGYIIPCRILTHFLESVRRFGLFPGVCRLGLQFQSMESEAMAELKKMDGRTGVLIRHVDPLSPCFGILQKGDVLLKIDGGTLSFLRSVFF